MKIRAQGNFGEVVLFRTKDGKSSVNVRLQDETVWLTLNQIAELFDRDKSVISRHLRNIYQTRELSRRSTVAKNATVQNEGGREVVRQVDYYNLDAILSVGYRINSKRGTQFRIWATSLLKKHLIEGYTYNERRLREKGLTEAQQAIQVLSRTLSNYDLVSDEGQAVLGVISSYAKTWLLLQQYDENRLALPDRLQPAHTVLDYGCVNEAIAVLKTSLMKRHEASDLFGQEYGDHLAGIIGSIEQTFDGKSLYPSIEEKASHLLYFIIKDHPFADGNKRIASFLFIIFLRENNFLEDATGASKINDNALVALALLIAASEPRNKELMIRLTMNLLMNPVDM